MDFQKGFDELFNEILTDYKNQFPEADLSQGSLLFVKSACQASALWGLYRYQDYIAAQIFPDSADQENLEHHGSIRGVELKAGESQPEYLARVLDYLRHPPAGGNRYDYPRWAKEVAGVAAAVCYPIARGLGTVDLVIVADLASGSEVPAPELVDQVQAYIDDRRPTTAKDCLVLPVVVDTRDVSVTTSGPCDTAQTAADIEAYLNTLAVDQPLYLTQLVALALSNGATNAVVTLPAADVVPASYRMIRPGAVNVA